MDAGHAIDAVMTALTTGKDMSRGASEWWKVWIATGGVALAVGWRWLPRRPAVLLLALLTAWSTANYFRMGPKTPFERVDSYDLIHYYLNAKYFDELGYFDLYPACVVADHDNNGPYYDDGVRYMAQDERGHHLAPIEHAVARGRVVKERFTPERWKAFEHDFLYLQRQVPGLNDEMWRQLIQDHGFNGTVAWTLEALPFVQAPVEYVKWLGYVDVVFLGAAILAVLWAWDGATALWATFFLMVTYSARWPTYTWALLRYDYISLLVIGMALVRKGRPFLGGVLTGWAATLRLFPAMWLFGPGAKGIFGLLDRKVHRSLLVLLAGFVVGAGVWQGAATVVFGGGSVVTHFENMEDHNSSANLSSRRIGLALALPFTSRMGPETAPKALPKSSKEIVEQQKPLRYALAGVTMLLLGWGSRRRPDEEGYALGFIPFFLLTTASYYYYVARLTLVVLHAGNLPRARHTVGLVWLLGLEVFSNWAETAWPERRVFLIGWLAWGLFAYALTMGVWSVWEDWRDGRRAAA